jgi:hypothetical protein
MAGQENSESVIKPGWGKKLLKSFNQTGSINPFVYERAGCRKDGSYGSQKESFQEISGQIKQLNESFGIFPVCQYSFESRFGNLPHFNREFDTQGCRTPKKNDFSLIRTNNL